MHSVPLAMSTGFRPGKLSCLRVRHKLLVLDGDLLNYASLCRLIKTNSNWHLRLYMDTLSAFGLWLCHSVALTGSVITTSDTLRTSTIILTTQQTTQLSTPTTHETSAQTATTEPATTHSTTAPLTTTVTDAATSSSMYSTPRANHIAGFVCCLSKVIHV